MQDELLGFVYLREDVSPDIPQVSNIQICDKPNIFYVEFDATMQSFGVMNRNHRMYDIENVWSCIQNDEKIQDLLRNSSWFGEVDHPTPKLKKDELSPERIMNPDMGNTSHKIMSPYRKGNLINARIQTDAGTAGGMNFAKKILQGMTPRFSARALAELVNKNGTPTVNMKRLITYDWVLYPSHVEAHANTTPKAVTKSVETVNEYAQADSIIIMPAIPIKEIYEYAVSKSQNCQVIMESLEITPEDLGITEDKSHILMKEAGGSVFGIKLEDQVRKNITGYLSNL